MQETTIVTEKKLAKLAKHIAKAFGISKEEAYELIYEEWELAEMLFKKHKKAKTVCEHFIAEVNIYYAIA